MPLFGTQMSQCLKISAVSSYSYAILPLKYLNVSKQIKKEKKLQFLKIILEWTDVYFKA